jgi:hypothetical protein
MTKTSIPRETFAIVTYCSLSYFDALEFCADSWLQNASAAQVVVYTDSPELARRVRPRDRLKIVHAFSPPAEEMPLFPIERKITALRSYFHETPQPFFVFLDCDCWVRQSFFEVFAGMVNTHVVGTRMLGRYPRRGMGHANSGVIFFRRHSSLGEFFRIWEQRTSEFADQSRIHLREQDAYSQLMLEGFDLLHPFITSLVSEHVYNCEHDYDDLWLRDIEMYQPKIIHFKKQRFRNESLKLQVASRIGLATL